MDISVSAILDKVIEAQRDAGYMESTIGQTRIAIRELKALAVEKGQIFYTKELGAEFAAMTTSPRTGNFSMRRFRLYGRLTRLCDSYLDTGSVDLSTKKRAPPVTFESGEHMSTYASFADDLAARNLADNTKNYYCRLACEYMRFLESKSISSTQNAPPETIFEFMEHLRSGTWSGTSAYHLASNFRPFLKFLQRQDLLDALSLINARRERKIIPVFEDDAQESIMETCCGADVSRRDAAITLLMITSGIRACDVIGMKLEDIDWIGGSISVLQKKTGSPLNIPLLPVVGNAICDYILNERPPAGSDYVFLRSLAPYVKLADHATVYNITNRVVKSAGLENHPCGSRAMRHNAASKMLRAGSQLPTIAAVLGHADPESTDIYITTDGENLRACVLPIPKGERNA